jgi:hypothetical protein
MALLVAAGRDIKRELLRGSDLARVRFAALAIGVFYNWTEAVFNRLSLVWFILLLAAVNYPRPTRRESVTVEVGLEAGRKDRSSAAPASFGV